MVLVRDISQLMNIKYQLILLLCLLCFGPCRVMFIFGSGMGPLNIHLKTFVSNELCECQTGASETSSLKAAFAGLKHL